MGDSILAVTIFDLMAELARGCAYQIESIGLRDSYILTPKTRIKFPPPNLPKLLASLGARGFGIALTRVPGVISAVPPEGYGWETAIGRTYPEMAPEAMEAFMKPLKPKGPKLPAPTGFMYWFYGTEKMPSQPEAHVLEEMQRTVSGLKKYIHRKWKEKPGPPEPSTKIPRPRAIASIYVENLRIEKNLNPAGVGTIRVYYMGEYGDKKIATIAVASAYEAEKKFRETILAAREGVYKVKGSY